jgi:predicted transcriptional regulator
VDDAGNAENNSGFVYFDEVYPEPVSVNVKTEAIGSGYAKIGDWINITVDVGGLSDIAAMWVDALGIFIEEPITQNYGSIWFLNTTISEGMADGLVQFIVTVVDYANNLNNTKYANAYVDNIYPTPDDFRLEHDFIPAKIGDAINITVVLQNHSDTQGEVQFTVTISDDANNIITLSKNTQVNNLPPSPDTKTPDEGISWGLVLLITCAALVGTGGVVVGATEIGHYSFFFIFYLLYTRLKKEYILDNFTRGRIYGYVEANPGEHFNAIKRALGIKNGSLAYHLRTLEKGGYIVSKRDRGYTRFYPKSMKLPKRNVKELIPIQRNIIDIIKSNPGISQRGIAEKMNISYQLVHYHIKVLQEANYLNLKKDRKQTYCYDTEELEEIPEVA